MEKDLAANTISVSETAFKWNISQRRVVVLCTDGRIPNATKIGNTWRIPQDASKPLDARIKEKEDVKPKPFLKWAGGKSRISKDIVKEFPSFKRYYEPFLGSAAVYFEVAPQNGILNDLNANLINTYKRVKDCPELLIKELTIIQSRYNNLNSLEEKKDYYYLLREEFNNLADSLKKSALLIFLNKAGWNGMYRENSSGLFNIPFGKKMHLNLFDADNLRRVSENIQGMEITSKDYKEVVKNAQSGDLIYFDPPYFDTFTDYQKNGFTDADQQELHDLAKQLSKKGCYVVISNSDCEKTRALYSDFTRIKEIPITRTIGSQLNSRKVIYELLILDF